MTLKTYNGSSFESVPYRYYDGTNWRGTPLYRYNGTEWVDAYLNDGLVAYYPFDGDVKDYSGNGLDGTDNTSAGYVAGRVGSSGKDYDGSDDSVDVGDDASLNFGTGDFTVSAWVNPSNLPNNHYVISKYRPGYVLYINGSAFRFRVDDGTNATDLSSTTTPSTDTWYHLFGIRSGGTSYLYVDNVEEASASADIDVASSNGLTIGAQHDGTNYYDGVIDDPRIYNRGISSTERDQIYQQGREI